MTRRLKGREKSLTTREADVNVSDAESAATDEQLSQNVVRFGVAEHRYRTGGFLRRSFAPPC